VSTLTHHDDFHHIVRIQPTTQKPSQILNFRRRTIHGHIRDNNIPGAIASKFIVLLEKKSRHHHANFVTFFVLACRDGNATFFLLVSFFTVTNHLVLQSTLSPQALHCLLLLLAPPSCPVLEELGDRVR